MAQDTSVGWLHESLADVAWRIKARARVAIQVVWAAENGEVHADVLEALPDVDPMLYVGTYSIVATDVQIEGDLQTMRDQRVRHRDAG